jgi:uncharacterized repeat protein (TIGR03803 family)
MNFIGTHRVYVTTFLLVLVLAALAQAQTFTTLYNFTGGSDGASPGAGVIQDATGNLYGTAEWGGGYGDGVVYEMNTAGAETVLYSFTGYPADGSDPIAPAARDRAGNIYGTTQGGGNSSGCGGFGCGTIFKIDTAGNERVLHNFTGGSDGCDPYQGLIMDNAGNLYGTTSGCGSSDVGTIFKIDPAENFTVLHTFARSDGAEPFYGHLTMDKSGNLYGVTSEGGDWGGGALYKLSKNRKLTLLHSFAGGTSDGCNPFGSVVRDEAGSLYGTTYDCGSTNAGTVWKVSKKGKETILHNFAFSMSDGCASVAGVARDSRGGNLYGVTGYCGAYGHGALYELGAKGRLTLLHSFADSDGTEPLCEVLRTSSGTLFGTTPAAGAYGYGTAWKYVP